MHQQPSLEQLFSALMFLLSRYAQRPDTKIPPAIREHLIWLAEHPDTAQLPALRSTCRRRVGYWESLPNTRNDGPLGPARSPNRVH